MSAVENTGSNSSNGSNGNGDSGWEVGGVSDAANNETEEARLRREISRLRERLALCVGASSEEDGAAADGGNDGGDSGRSGGGAGVTASSIRSELSVVTTTIFPPENSGYLFKWQDRSIRWGGTESSRE